MSPELHERVRKLFDVALGKPEAERLSFLQFACAGEPEVLQAVMRLLEAHRSSESFLANETRPTQHIGRYLVTGELGRGAMGVVYEAVDPLIGRKIAVKVIILQADAGEAQFLRDRLFREARSAGALSHPNIVTVFDVGHEGDTAFIAMERVEGVSLYQVLSSGRKLPRAEAIEILKQTASALDHAHKNGVVHRDIKPANIMLDRGVTVKVADFGIAKITSAEQQTRTGLVMGTPSYMSPEQIEALPADGRSDQFSLAVVAYELLTGSRPFQSDSLATLAHMIVYAPRPSARASSPGLPAAVDMVLHRSMSRLPTDRYPTCTEFVKALEEASNATEAPVLPKVEAPIPAPVLKPVPPPLIPASSKNPASVSVRNLLIAGVVLLILLGGFLAYKLVSSNPNKVLSNDKETPANPPPAVTSAVAKPAAPVVTQFAVAPQSVVAGSTATLRWDVTGATEVVVDQGIGKMAPAAVIDVRPLKPTTYMLTATGPGGNVTAQAFLNVTPSAAVAGSNPPKQLPAASTQAPADNATRARKFYADGIAQRNAHQNAKALDLFRQAADLGDSQAMVELGELYMEDNAGSAGDVKEAAQWFRKAADAGNSSGMLHLGVMYYLGAGVPEDYGEAATWYRKAANAGNADAMYNLGKMYENGQGVPRDLTQANVFYLKAEGLGNTEAKAALARLTNKRK
jgi:serine/threonine protein kinase